MKIVAAHALLPEGWAREVLIEVGANGRIGAVTSNAPRTDAAAERIEGFVVPGMPNVHSHAFQRAMAGAAEARARPDDSFWTWRELMYRFAGRITPGQMGDVAAWLYVEMLKAGYTSVAEFHYVHHDVGGKPYADPAQMSHPIVAAARDAGIALTHLPVLYQHGGFGEAPALSSQARFIHSAETYASLLEALHGSYGNAPDVRIGVAFHSLRAVAPRSMGPTLAALDCLDATAPVHIHAAEQAKEVEDCIAWSGSRPVAWLLDHHAIGPRWCLVHATHLDAGEIGRLAASAAVAGLCPTTEANLGDGIFPARAYLGAAPGGRIAIGSDSHVEVSVAGELKLLEYGQRLVSGARSALASGLQPSPAERLHAAASAGGAQALGIDAGRIASGCRADLVVLDSGHPALWNKAPRQALDAWVFAGDGTCVRDVMVGGAWRIRDRHHPREREIGARFRAAQAALLA